MDHLPRSICQARAGLMPALVFLRRTEGGRGVCVVQTCTDARSACKAAHVGTTCPTPRSKRLRRCAFPTCAAVQPLVLRLQAALGSGFSLQAAFWYQNAMLAQQEKPKTQPASPAAVSYTAYNLAFLHFEFRSRYISRYENLKFGFLPFVVASIVAMVFFSAVFAARAPAMGNSADRAWQLSQLMEGVLTAFNPSHGSLSYVQAGHCVSKQIGRHDAACQGCPRCVSRSPVLGTPQSRTALWGEEKQRSD